MRSARFALSRWKAGLFFSARRMMRRATSRMFRSAPRSGATTMVMSFLLSSHFHEITSSVGAILPGVTSGLWKKMETVWPSDSSKMAATLATPRCLNGSVICMATGFTLSPVRSMTPRSSSILRSSFA